AKNMMDRYDAISALAFREFEGKEAFLMQRYQEETFHGIKGEIISQILPQMNENATTLTKQALADLDAEVRKAALNNTVRISTELEPLYRKLLQDSSYQVIEKTLDLLSFYFPQNIDEYLKITENEKGNRSLNVRIKHLSIDYQKNNNEEALNELVDYTSNSFEFLTRVNAAETLQEMNQLNETALANLLDATFSFNGRLSGPATQVINHFFEQSAYKRMILNYVSNKTWSDSEFKKVKKYMIP
ncbi:MAG: hypothetical protein KDB74_03025, partial [Flavobacteriales bacterium]|nr:hypothetical protein [Flavobacteriales bacterium]